MTTKMVKIHRRKVYLTHDRRNEMTTKMVKIHRRKVYLTSQKQKQNYQ